ncbi:hypothetical protein MPTK1_1g17520 [Marchantia polymorpha subsp. ruderalis]|uniref:Small multi-drug export n=2 Tax=Marchantia polymorpha TaxID=3197 RepID=A0AAF6AR86_MARPO|nr:hypothetical protein MARPO_0001s0092 [Marchantia polymorpha]BBM98956.1 hypothetical protein Mp_1g17520 [Marchantia polymorpha subsp. ruderalis]|eukprot:PTQ50033.1 hypothetical protein MARPO_0001s0092 [Marchantia polymorpha]
MACGCIAVSHLLVSPQRPRSSAALRTSRIIQRRNSWQPTFKHAAARQGSKISWPPRPGGGIRCSASPSPSGSSPCSLTEARHEDGDEDETSEGRTRAAAAARNKKLVKLAFFALALLACNSGSHAALAVAESSIAASSLGVKVASFLRGSGWPDELVVLTVAMLPVLELRGAIPISYWLRVDPIKGYFIAVLGNMLPVPLIVLYLDKLSTFLGERSSTAKKVLDWVFERTRKKGGVIEEFEWLGLMLFVAVPFPGTGAWTGAILAAILGMPFWEAMTANFFGVVLAGLLVNIVVTVGGKAALGVGAVLFAISTFMWTVLRMIRNKKNEDA